MSSVAHMPLIITSDMCLLEHLSIHIRHKYPISLNKQLGAHLKFCLKEGCLFEGGCLNEGVLIKLVQ